MNTNKFKMTNLILEPAYTREKFNFSYCRSLLLALFLSISFNCATLSQELGKIENVKYWIRTTTNSITIDWIPENNQSSFPAEIIISQINDSSVFWKGLCKGVKTAEGIRYQITELSPELWNPSKPFLYHLDISIKKDEQRIDEKRFRIGFRAFESKNGNLFLNGNHIFLRGIAINPPGRGIPQEIETSRKFAEEYVAFMKSINVNIIRIPDDQTWYDVCDELGMMVFGGNYSGSVNGENPPVDYNKGVDWYIKVKFSPIMHHPSLVIYALTNEVPYKGLAAEKWNRFLAYAHPLLKEWDPTRLFIGNAGYGYGKGGDINDIHRYWGWYYSSAFTFLHVRDYDSITFPKSIQPLTFTECVGNYTGPDGRYNLTPNHKNPVSQQNWTGHAADEDQSNLADQHQTFTFKTVTELMRRLRRINPEASGVFPFTIMFRNWHTISSFSDMLPKPVTKQAKLSYQPVLISWENWKPQIYAGTLLTPIVHIINDSEDFSELSEGSLIIRLLDKALTVIYSDTIDLPDIPYYDIYSKKLSINIPENLSTGEFILEGVIISNSKEISRNNTSLFITTDKFRGVPSQKKVLLYDLTGTTMNSFVRNGIKAERIFDFKKIGTTSTIVIGENSADRLLTESLTEINDFISDGGRLIIFKQENEHQSFIKPVIPTEISFPSLDIDNPTYPPPPRPSRNSFNINPERPDHPVFSGITRDLLRIWNDYYEWDETLQGYPAIYPVTDGFILRDKSGIEFTAILANYSVGLEGIALAEFFRGKGSIILSGFDLCKRAGIDPVADRLLINIVKYMSDNHLHENHILIEAPIIWGKYESEKGLLTGIYSGFMLNSKPALSGSYEGLPLILQKDGHMFAEKGGGWNNAAGKQYVPYGRRIFGPYIHRDFGGVPIPLKTESTQGQAQFWCRIPDGTKSMSTIIWNPAEEPLTIRIEINDKVETVKNIGAGQYTTVISELDKSISDIKIMLKGDRRLVVLETSFN